MKLVKLLALGGLLVASTSAFATTLNGTLNVGGKDQFDGTAGTIQFVNPSASVAASTISQIATGSAVTFASGSLSYTPSGSFGPTGIEIASVGSGSSLIQFYITFENYDYTPNIHGSGYNDLDLYGSGYFLTADGVETAATFNLDSQEAVNSQAGTITTFTASSTATGMSPTPEPSSLLLLGSGLVGTAGMLFRRRRTSEAI